MSTLYDDQIELIELRAQVAQLREALETLINEPLFDAMTSEACEAARAALAATEPQS